MAIYHCSVKIIGRSSGRSSVASAAYRAGQKITNERDGITHDYTRKNGVVHSEIILSDHAPSEYNDRATLWNAVEKIERRSDSQTAREVEVALPLEFSLKENIGVVRNYITENFTSKGMCADFAIHSNEGNPHAHILLTTRDISPEGFGKKNRDWNNVQLLEQWRKNWAKECNIKLEEKGLQKIDHRSLQAQRLERIPTIHVGISKTRKVKNDEIIKFNEKYKPENISLYINELNKGYIIVKNEINELNNSERELRKIEGNIKEISKRSQDLHKQYNELQQAKSRREKTESMENMYKYSLDYFERSFKIPHSEADNEIRRLENDYKNIIQTSGNETKNLYTKKMQDYETEYKRQILLAEIRPDRDEIFRNLDRTDMKLNKITQDDYRELTQNMHPSQITLLETERYNQTKRKEIFDLER